MQTQSRTGRILAVGRTGDQATNKRGRRLTIRDSLFQSSLAKEKGHRGMGRLLLRTPAKEDGSNITMSKLTG